MLLAYAVLLASEAAHTSDVSNVNIFQSLSLNISYQ